MSPSWSTHTPLGRLNWPTPLPDCPKLARCWPSGANFWIRSLRQSATYTLPSVSRPSAEAAELTQVFAIQRKLLDAVVAAIGHAHRAVGDCQPCRLVQFAVSR